jgi:hypothetical protein
LALCSLIVSHGHGEVMRGINREEWKPSPFSFLLVQYSHFTDTDITDNNFPGKSKQYVQYSRTEKYIL